MNSTITDIKNTLEEINSRITKAEQISELEDRNNCRGAEERKKDEKNWGQSRRPLGQY